MLDAAFIRDNAEAVKANCRNRGVPDFPVDRVVEFDKERRRLIHDRDPKRELTNKESSPALKRYIDRRKKEPKGTKFPSFLEWLAEKHPDTLTALAGDGITPANIDTFLKDVRDRGEELGVLEAKLRLVEGDLTANLIQIPNMTHPAAPVGTEAANKVVANFGEPRKFDFKPRDHVALCEALDLADFEAGTKVAGQKFYFLKNEGALLEMALVQYAMQTVVKRVHRRSSSRRTSPAWTCWKALASASDPNPDTRQVYTVSDTDLCLIATAEITLWRCTATRSSTRPNSRLRYVGLSHCFRRRPVLRAATPAGCTRAPVHEG